MNCEPWKWTKWAAGCGGEPPEMCGHKDCQRTRAWLVAKVIGIALVRGTAIARLERRGR
jgi:hypothetical protein